VVVRAARQPGGARASRRRAAYLGYDDLLDSLRPYGHEPIRVELLFRPYPHMRDLDLVADRHRRRWTFCAPWWWVELDHDDASQGLPAPLAGPAWPLTLLAGFDAQPVADLGLGDPDRAAGAPVRQPVQDDRGGGVQADLQRQRWGATLSGWAGWQQVGQATGQIGEDLGRQRRTRAV